MTFLDPGVLWALPLAAFPLLLHMVFLRKARRFPFSDLELLREAYLRSLPASRLRQWLLALLRALALALLTLAFARPVLRPEGSWASGGEGGLDAVLLVDLSWSMGAQDRGKSRLEWARAAGDSFLKLLKPSARVAVLPFSEGTESAPAWADPAAAGEPLSRLR
ncbi:MAG: VWA domain-containing protein, partial [Elusimicrobiota bacterium]